DTAPSCAAHRLPLRIIGRRGDYPGGALGPYDMGGKPGALGRAVTIEKGHGQRFAKGVPVSARGDEANAPAILPDGLVATGLGIVRLDLQSDDLLCGSPAVMLFQCGVAADEIALLPVDPSVQPGLRRGIALRELGRPDAEGFL